MNFFLTFFVVVVSFLLQSCSPRIELIDETQLGSFSGRETELFNPNLISPLHVVSTPDSVSEISLFWLGGEDSLADYQISWVEGSVAPDSCVVGNIVPVESIVGSEFVVTGLDVFKTYSFRVCVVDLDGKLSSGTTVTEKTLPSCDDTISTSTSFRLFKVILDSLVDHNADGTLALCLDDGVDITTNNSGEGDIIYIESSNVYIYANRSSVVNFINTRTDLASASATGVFEIRNVSNISFSNINLSTVGDQSRCITAWSTGNPDYAIDVVSNFTCVTSGASSYGFTNNSRKFKTFKDLTVITSGSASRALRTSSQFDNLLKFNLRAIGPCAGGCGMGIDVYQGSFKNILWGSIRSNQSTGIQLYQSSISRLENVSILSPSSASLGIRSDSFIDQARNLILENTNDWVSAVVDLSSTTSYIKNLDNVVVTKAGKGNSGVYINDGAYIDSFTNIQIRRKASSTQNASAIQIKDTGWINTENVRNVEICSEIGTARFWEDNTTSASVGILAGASSAVSPASHRAYDPGVVLGAQTFPFDVLDGSGQQMGVVEDKSIILGGICSN